MGKYIVNCPRCDQSLEVQDEWTNMLMRCPACNANFIIPQRKTNPPQVQQNLFSTAENRLKKQSKTYTPYNKPACGIPDTAGILCWLVFVAVIILAGTVVLYIFDPMLYHFYHSECLIYQHTGILCPGCGNLRAAYMLLHGRVRPSLICNLMLFPTLCYIGLIIFCKNQKIYWVTAIWLITLMAYTIFRNLNLKTMF